jgi:hypothetical protein
METHLMYHFNLINSPPLKVSPHGSFKVTQLCESVAICEAMKGDRNNWGNGTETEPAFVAYLGCKKEEVEGYIKTFNTFYRCELCEVREPKYLKGFEVEIKVRGMQRDSDSHAFGLDYLVESQQWQEIGCDSDEYEYRATGVMPRW